MLIGNWAQAKGTWNRWAKEDRINCFIHPEIGNPPRMTKIQAWQEMQRLGVSYIDKPSTKEEADF